MGQSTTKAGRSFGSFASQNTSNAAAIASPGEALAAAFEVFGEHRLPKDRPAFVVDWPFETSPLSRRRDSDPRLVDRFELFVAGMEVANAFS